MNFLRKDRIFFVISFIVLAGFFLRAFAIGSPSLWIDEGFTLMQVRAIQEQGYPLLASGRIEWKDALLPYLLSIVPSMGAFGWFRMISVLFGTASIMALYALGKIVFNTRVAVLASGMMAFSYWHIAWSRQIRSYSLLVFFVLIALVFIFQYGKIGRLRSLVLSGTACVLAVLSKLSGVFIVPVIMWYAVCSRSKKNESSGILSNRAVTIVISGTFAIGILVWIWKSGFGITSWSAFFYYLDFYTIGYFWKTFGILFALALLGGYLSYYYVTNKRMEHAVLIVIFFASLFFFSYFVYVNQKRYLLFVTPILFLYASFLLDYWASLFKHRLMVLVFITGICIGIDQLTVRSLLFFPRTFFALEDYTPQPDFQKAYIVLDGAMRPGDKIISAYPFMDQIYLGRADYALALSYTGKDRDLSVTSEHKEYYSGIPEILSIAQIKKMSTQSDVYIILDDMALDRANPKYIDFIQNEAELFWTDKASFGQAIFIYRVPRSSL